MVLGLLTVQWRSRCDCRGDGRQVDIRPRDLVEDINEGVLGTMVFSSVRLNADLRSEINWS
jgi:hypothetical protein